MPRCAMIPSLRCPHSQEQGRHERGISSSYNNPSVERCKRTSPGREPGRSCDGVIIGRTSEYFDFFVYAIASVLVFPSGFSPSDAAERHALSFAIFALAFIARPIGDVIFMAIERAYGRGVKLTVALFLLGARPSRSAFCRAIRRSLGCRR